MHPAYPHSAPRAPGGRRISARARAIMMAAARQPHMHRHPGWQRRAAAHYCGPGCLRAGCLTKLWHPVIPAPSPLYTTTLNRCGIVHTWPPRAVRLAFSNFNSTVKLDASSFTRTVLLSDINRGRFF